MMTFDEFFKLAGLLQSLKAAGLPVQYITLGCFTVISFDPRHMDAGECYELLWSVLNDIDFDVTISNTNRNFPYLIISNYGTKN